MRNGKSYWIKDTLEYEGTISNDLEHTIALVENIIIDDGMISMFIPNQNYLDREYRFTLLPNDIGLAFTGTDEDVTINCEVFSNDKREMVYGKWKEGEANYTWWVITDK